MTSVVTNRDLYCFIAKLVQRQSKAKITLESYLKRLRQLARAWSHRSTLTASEFAGLLEAGFESSSGGQESSSNAVAEYRGWKARISEQIRDLGEMAQAGTLANVYRYFGVDAPSGARWYNFDPCTFIECAAMGSFGGWREGEDTDREYVPGPVAVLDAFGAITSVDPRAIDDSVVDLKEITWGQFTEFLEAGQWYE
jgi:hypothetical protein